MPARLAVSHAPATHCSFKPLDDLDLTGPAGEQLRCRVLLGRGSYVQRFLKLDFEGGVGGAGAHAWRLVLLSDVWRGCLRTHRAQGHAA